MSTPLMRTLTRGLLVAMLLAVLAPGISRARASTRVVGDWVEVCTAEGMQWMQLGAQALATEPNHAGDLRHALDPCSHCALSAECFAPLLPSLPALPVGSDFWAPPAYLTITPYVLDAPSPGARGPPLLS